MISVVTPPAIEPVSLTEAKAHCRVDGSSDDAVLMAMIPTAREIGEAFTGRKWITQTVDYTLETGSWPWGRYIEIPVGYIQSITSLTYIDSAGNPATFASSNWYLEQTSAHGRLRLNNDAFWPTTTLRDANAITIRVVCGYGAASTDVPAPLIHGLKLLIGAMFAHREDFVVEQGVTVSSIPADSRRLWWPYKIA